MKEDLLPTNVTIDQGNLIRGVIRSWDDRDKSQERSGRPDINRDTRHELKQGPVGHRSSNARQLGCVFQDMKPPKSILRQTCRNQTNV